MHPVGTIRQLARYPVKSMCGERLDTATLTLQGVAEDRRYAFVQTASRSSFPWLTARELPELLRYQPTLEDGGPEGTVVTVATPSGEKWPVASEELRREIEERTGRALFLLHDYRGSYDTAPISLISRQTVARIAEESGTEENPRRFRPNLVVDLQEGGPFEEMNWVGRILRIGDAARVAIIKVDQRCMMITLDPDRATISPSVLRCVAQQHDKCAGVYGVVITAGETRVGDTVLLES